MRPFVALVLFFAILFVAESDIDEEEEKLPTRCHVCKHLVQELQDELERSGKSNEIFRTGQIFQEQRKEINYRKSEVRLNEALENACSNVLDYKVHKDKVKALRYEKKESVTFNTLKGLKNRGVKVELGFPYEMWDTPDAEVTRLKSRCELMVETFEDDLTQWYWHHQNDNLTEWLCLERVLDPGEEGKEYVRVYRLIAGGWMVFQGPTPCVWFREVFSGGSRSSDMWGAQSSRS
ncbi:hypothetical protein ACROYT_G004981 [Oculina patagonica]